MPRVIVHVIHDLRPGGTERRMLAVLAGLDRSRFRLILCCVNGLGELAQDAADLDVEPVVLGRRTRFDTRGALRLAQLVRREGAEIVHGWLNLANFFARVGGRLGGAPIVIASEGGAVLRLSGIRAQLWRTLELGLEPLTDVFLANSLAVADRLRRHGAPSKKIEVIPNGVAIPEAITPEQLADFRASLGAKPGERLIGMVSRLDPASKDHRTLLRAFASLSQQRRNIRLAIVGDGPARPTLEQLVDDLRLTEHVVFTGFRPDASDLIAALDVSILCSFSEGFSNVLLESMARRRPLVVSDIPANREAIVHNVHGLLVRVGDVAATAAMIEKVLDDSSLARALGSAARDRAAQEFSLEAQAERTMALYDRLLAQKRR